MKANLCYCDSKINCQKLPPAPHLSLPSYEKVGAPDSPGIPDESLIHHVTRTTRDQVSLGGAHLLLLRSPVGFSSVHPKSAAIYEDSPGGSWSAYQGAQLPPISPTTGPGLHSQTPQDFRAAQEDYV